MLRVFFLSVTICLSTVIRTLPLLLLAVLKLIIPLRSFRYLASGWITAIATSWITFNSMLIDRFTPTRFSIIGGESIRSDGRYLLIANHQSWVDIPVLQKILNHRAPFQRFFLKSTLIWVPVIGLAWWALDYPFMKRYSRDFIAKNPHLRGRDVEETRRACEKFRQIPVSITNFVEGTRFTKSKYQQQNSPFRHLLKPKAGGTAFVVETLGDVLESIIDVTIVYPQGVPTMIDLIAGRISEVRIDIAQRPIPADFIGGSYENDSAYRERFQGWLNTIWQEKDQLIEQILSSNLNSDSKLH